MNEIKFSLKKDNIFDVIVEGFEAGKFFLTDVYLRNDKFYCSFQKIRLAADTIKQKKEEQNIKEKMKKKVQRKEVDLKQVHTDKKEKEFVKKLSNKNTKEKKNGRK
jgi:predicted methyltransferase MtxX (methanogen marker protein 4)